MNLKDEATTITVNHHKGYEFGLGDEAPEQADTKELTIRKFLSEPARVAIEKRSSFQVMPEMWRGFSIRIEVPCYPEEIDTVRQEAMRYVSALALEEEQKLLIGQLNYYQTPIPEKTLTDTLEGK